MSWIDKQDSDHIDPETWVEYAQDAKRLNDAAEDALDALTTQLAELPIRIYQWSEADLPSEADAFRVFQTFDNDYRSITRNIEAVQDQVRTLANELQFRLGW